MSITCSEFRPSAPWSKHLSIHIAEDEESDEGFDELKLAEFRRGFYKQEPSHCANFYNFFISASEETLKSLSRDCPFTSAHW